MRQNGLKNRLAAVQNSARASRILKVCYSLLGLSGSRVQRRSGFRPVQENEDYFSSACDMRNMKNSVPRRIANTKCRSGMLQNILKTATSGESVRKTAFTFRLNISSIHQSPWFSRHEALKLLKPLSCWPSRIRVSLCGTLTPQAQPFPDREWGNIIPLPLVYPAQGHARRTKGSTPTPERQRKGQTRGAANLDLV